MYPIRNCSRRLFGVGGRSWVSFVRGSLLPGVCWWWSNIVAWNLMILGCILFGTVQGITNIHAGYIAPLFCTILLRSGEGYRGLLKDIRINCTFKLIVCCSSKYTTKSYVSHFFLVCFVLFAFRMARFLFKNLAVFETR